MKSTLDPWLGLGPRDGWGWGRLGLGPRDARLQLRPLVRLDPAGWLRSHPDSTPAKTRQHTSC